MSDIAATLEQRGKQYGEFKDHAAISQGLKRVMYGRSFEALSDDKKEALEMIMHKVARILNGDPEYKDNWHDIVGYAKLVDDSLEAKND